MFKFCSTKTNLYKKLKIGNKNINLMEKYDIFHLKLTSSSVIHSGHTIFKDKSKKLIFLNKPFFFFVITRVPKPYPFKVIKS